jgi:hypothetical protein
MAGASLASAPRLLRASVHPRPDWRGEREDDLHRLPDNSSSDFTFLGGAGLDISKFFIEAKYMSIQSDPSSANMLVVTGGIRFGGN